MMMKRPWPKWMVYGEANQRWNPMWRFLYEFLFNPPLPSNTVAPKSALRDTRPTLRYRLACCGRVHVCGRVAKT